MTTENQNAFGASLQAAREALNLDIKEAARQLRLNEKVILILEENQSASHIPPTFLRGYIRAYAKFLQIPDHETQAALATLQPAATSAISAAPVIPTESVTSSHYFIRGFTSLVIITMVALVATWWHTHTRSPAALPVASAIAENQQAIPIINNAPTEQATAPSTTAPAATSSTPSYTATATTTASQNSSNTAANSTNITLTKPTHIDNTYPAEKLIEDDSEGDESD